MPKLVWDERHWSDRAEEARIMSAGIRNPECKKIMLELAATYEQLARLTTEFKTAAETQEPQPALAKPLRKTAS